MISHFLFNLILVLFLAIALAFQRHEGRWTFNSAQFLVTLPAASLGVWLGSAA